MRKLLIDSNPLKKGYGKSNTCNKNNRPVSFNVILGVPVIQSIAFPLALFSIMAPRRESFIDWKNSEAKYVLLDDLERGILPLSAQEVSAEEAWVVYQDHPSFEGVQFRPPSSL